MPVVPTTIAGLPTLTVGPVGAGALGAYVGTVDPVNDLIPIYDASTTSTVNVYRNQYLNLSSAPVGLTDTQNIANKTLATSTLTAPIINGTITGTYTIGGTPTFPASVVTLTGSQTLTNKILTSPTINSPTITNASITADAITGYTTSNSGTIYSGISVATGNVSMSGTLSVTGNSTFAGTLGVTGVLTPSAGLSANSVKSTALALSNALDSSHGVQSQANAGTAGGTMYYINLGGIKLLWLTTGALYAGNSATTPYTVTLPTSFFTTIQGSIVSSVAYTSTYTLYPGISGISTTTATLSIQNTSGSVNGDLAVSLWIIGT